MYSPVPCLQTPLWEHLHLFPLTSVNTVILTCPLLFFQVTLLAWLLTYISLLFHQCHSMEHFDRDPTPTPGVTRRLVDSLWFLVSLSNLPLSLLVTWPTKVNTSCLAVSRSTQILFICLLSLLAVDIWSTGWTTVICHKQGSSHLWDSYFVNNLLY